MTQCYQVSISIFPTFCVILTLLDGWIIEKNMLSIKAKIKQIISFFIKEQTLASTKKQRRIQNPVKHLWRSSSGEFKGLPDPHPHPHLVFVTVNQVEVFSRNITLSVTGFNLRNVQHFKWSSTLKLSDGLRIKHCYWTRTKAKKKFIDFGWKIEADAKTAGLLFRLIGLDCWCLIADSNFIYHKETR